MRVLITNDDGILSEGLKSLAEVLYKKGHEVIVVAPDGNRSAFSHSLSIYKNLVFSPTKALGEISAYTLSGTPADCVKFACHYFKDKTFDIVCSGINLGNNLGSDVCYSGTVAAGLEANFFGIKSIAFSNLAHRNNDFSSNIEFIGKFFEKLCSLAGSSYTLNVNMPNGKYNGVKFTKLGKQLYSDEYSKNEDGTYILTGYPVSIEQDEDTDVVASSKGFITITPILYDRTAKDVVNKYKDLTF